MSPLFCRSCPFESACLNLSKSGNNIGRFMEMCKTFIQKKNTRYVRYYTVLASIKIIWLFVVYLFIARTSSLRLMHGGGHYFSSFLLSAKLLKARILLTVRTGTGIVFHEFYHGKKCINEIFFILKISLFERIKE